MRKYSGTIALRALAMATSAGGGLIVARLLGPAERGFLAFMLVPVTYVVAFAGTGMRQPIAKQVSGARDPTHVVGTMLVASGLGMVAATSWGSVRAGMLPGLAAGGLCAGMVVFAFFEALAIANGAIKRVLWGQLAVQVVFIAGALLLYVQHLPSPLALVAFQFGAFVLAACGFYRREARSMLVRPVLSGNAVGVSTRHAAAVLALTLLCRVDVFAAALLLPGEHLGHYVVAASFGEFLSQMPAFAGFLVFAETPRNVADKRRRLFGMALRTFLLSSAAAAVLSLCVPWVLMSLLGPQYASAAELFIWLLPAYVLSSVLRVAAGFSAAIGATGTIVRTSAAGALTFAGLLAVALPSGIASAQIALYAALAQAAALTVLAASVSMDARYE